MSGLTSQPNMGAVVNALAGTPLDTGIDPKQLLVLNNYWCVWGPEHTSTQRHPAVGTGMSLFKAAQSHMAFFCLCQV